jgi:prophage regulatory protein
MSQMLIPYSALAAKGINLSKCQIWRLERQGKFPKRVPISPARHAWVESEIDAHIAERIASRNGKVAAQ